MTAKFLSFGPFLADMRCVFAGSAFPKDESFVVGHATMDFLNKGEL